MPVIVPASLNQTAEFHKFLTRQPMNCNGYFDRAATGGIGIGPPPPENPMFLPRANELDVNTIVTTNIRVAIFMIKFLQYFPSSEFLPRKLRIDYMKTRNALQQLILRAVFANSPMLNIGQCNEFHTVVDFLPASLLQTIQIQELTANLSNAFLRRQTEFPESGW